MTGSGLMKFLTLPIRFPRWKLAVSFCRHSLPFSIQNSPNPPFRLTRTLRFSIKPARDCKQMQTKSPEKPSYFRKLYISFSKYLHFSTQTILFHASNTCVWQLKQYSFTTQTILFHPRKSNVCRRSTVSTNRKLSLRPSYFPPTVIQKPLPLHEHPNNTPSPESASICILRIARECPRNPPTRIFVRARPL